MTGALLDPDFREAARALVATGRLRAETSPEPYRQAVRGKQALATFFRAELGWTLEVIEVAQLIRLHKRRVDVPDDRGPTLIRAQKEGRLAPKEVLVCVALVCEQLWRRPKMSLRELLQALAQVCATEAAAGSLPEFQVVGQDGPGKRLARQNRQVLADALRLLVEEGTVTVDADLERAVSDEETDLVVSTSRERLAAKFSSLSPVLLGLDGLPADRHAAVLSEDSLPTGEDEKSEVPDLEQRRLRLLRRLVDDPAADPVDDPTGGSPYLHTLSGRERALNVLHSLGFAVSVRKDWWEVTDPSGIGTGIVFPDGRRTERQAALTLLAELPRRDDPAEPLSLAEIVEIFERARASVPRWAAAYSGRPTALARAAAAELAAVGLLRPNTEQSDSWCPTPGIHLWRVRVRHPRPTGNTGVEQ